MATSATITSKTPAQTSAAEDRARVADALDGEGGQPGQPQQAQQANGPYQPQRPKHGHQHDHQVR
jgi:hypothetical protein